MKNAPPKTLTVTCCAIASLFLALPSQTLSQSNLSGSCNNFEDKVQQTNWWLQEYGPLLTAGSLFLDASQGEDLRIGQLFLMLEELNRTDVSDLQKHLTITVELYSLLDAPNPADSDTIFRLLGGSARSKLASQSTNFKKLQVCAFECPSGPEGGLSDAFRACIVD